MADGTVSKIDSTSIITGTKKNEKIKPDILKTLSEKGYYVANNNGVVTLGIKKGERVIFITFDKPEPEWFEGDTSRNLPATNLYFFTTISANINSGRIEGHSGGMSPFYPEILDAIKQNQYQKAIEIFKSTPTLQLFN
jgi:hypothetical protein